MVFWGFLSNPFSLLILMCRSRMVLLGQSEHFNRDCTQSRDKDLTKRGILSLAKISTACPNSNALDSKIKAVIIHKDCSFKSMALAEIKAACASSKKNSADSGVSFFAKV